MHQAVHSASDSDELTSDKDETYHTAVGWLDSVVRRENECCDRKFRINERSPCLLLLLHLLLHLHYEPDNLNENQLESPPPQHHLTTSKAGII